MAVESEISAAAATASVTFMAISVVDDDDNGISVTAISKLGASVTVDIKFSLMRIRGSRGPAAEEEDDDVGEGATNMGSMQYSVRLAGRSSVHIVHEHIRVVVRRYNPALNWSQDPHADTVNFR